jgi:hypothetical protein
MLEAGLDLQQAPSIDYTYQYNEITPKTEKV